MVAVAWLTAGWWTAERLTAAAIVGQLVVFAGQLAVLVAAARYASNQVKGIRDQVDEARELRESQARQAQELRESQARQAQELREAERELREAEARPYVVIDFEPGDRPPLMNLIVANLGRTMARNLRIEIHPPLRSSLDAKTPVPVARLKLFTEPIPSLAPGKRIVFVFDSLRQRPKELPTAYRATLRYDGERGPLPPDEQHLDLELYYNLLSVDRKTIHDVNETLTNILRRFEQWSAGPEGGVLGLSPDEKHQRDQEFFTWATEQQAAEARGAEHGRVGLAGRLTGAVGRLRRRGEAGHRS